MQANSARRRWVSCSHRGLTVIWTSGWVMRPIICVTVDAHRMGEAKGAIGTEGEGWATSRCKLRVIGREHRTPDSDSAVREVSLSELRIAISGVLVDQGSRPNPPPSREEPSLACTISRKGTTGAVQHKTRIQYCEDLRTQPQSTDSACALPILFSC